MTLTPPSLRNWLFALSVGCLLSPPAAARAVPGESASEASSDANGASPEPASGRTTESNTPLAPPRLAREQLEDLVRWTADDAWRGDMPAVLERLEPWIAAMKSENPDAKLARTYWQRLATAYVALEQPLEACEPLRHAKRLGGGVNGPAGSWASPRIVHVEQQCASALEEEVP